jgi:filamentous hemagglutinin
MPPSVTPNATAEAFAKAAFNGQTPDVVTPILSGNSWVAKLPDGTVVTFRVAGDAGVSTMSSTATVEINSQAVRVINSGNVAKFKFPSR